MLIALALRPSQLMNTSELTLAQLINAGCDKLRYTHRKGVKKNKKPFWEQKGFSH